LSESISNINIRDFSSVLKRQNDLFNKLENIIPSEKIHYLYELLEIERALVLWEHESVDGSYI